MSTTPCVTTPPRDDYYGELAGHADRARAVGWESAAAQAARYEVVRRHVRAGDRVLDLGAGLGDLARHLDAHGWAGDYLGLERDRRLVTRGRATPAPPWMRLREADLFADPVGTAEVVAAVGVLVDGGSLRSDGVRFARLRRLLDVVRAAAARTAVVVLLDQDRLEAHPILATEPALGGMRPSELAWLVPDAARWELTRLLDLDLALILQRAG